MNVVEQWRARARDLRGTAWTCESCGRFASVRRTYCANCRGKMTSSMRRALPRSLRATAWSHAHLVFEHLDQVQDRHPAMLLEATAGQLIAMELAETDAPRAKELVGEELSVVVRRSGDVEARAPIVYRRKVAATAATRARLNRQAATKKQKQDKVR